MEKRLALLIGNSEYAHAQSLLGSPVQNVNALGIKLQQLGFDLIRDTDCTLSRMQQMEDEFLRRLPGYQVGLFYFAGHGIEHDGVNYLLPSDDPLFALPHTDLAAQRWMRKNLFSFNQRHEAFITHYERSKVNIAILDCCRSDPLPNTREEQDGEEAEVTAPHGAFYAFAASPRQYAWFRNGLSFYTQRLVKWIDAPGLTLEEMFRNVRREVAAEEIHYHSAVFTQIGWDHSSLIGDFCLNPAPARREEARTAYCPHCGAAVTQADGDTCPFCRRTLH